MKNQEKTRWKVTERYRKEGQVRLRNNVIEIAYEVREVRTFRGQREERTREELRIISRHELLNYSHLFDATLNFLSLIEHESFGVVENQCGLTPQRDPDSRKIRVFGSGRVQKNPLGKALLGPDPFEDTEKV